MQLNADAIGQPCGSDTRGGEQQISQSRTAPTAIPLTQAPVHIGGYARCLTGSAATLSD
jgi:hypothetical protein